jgi:ABC-type branched-subunit amino acid transport system ATPase component
VEVGEVVGLIGSNGAGKSTLMNVISGFQPTVAGAVVLWGQEVGSYPPHERARLGVGRTFQDARLFGDLTVRETVKVALEVHEQSEFIPSLLGYPPARRVEHRRSGEAAQLMDFLGLGHYADSFISDLSTGTRRIVELCCLLAHGSKLLLLDEPTAGVAQREAEAFGPLIQRVRAELDATIVIIEHDMPLVMSISDRVYCMDAGRCIAEGDPHTVRNDPVVIAAYLGTDERAIARSGALQSGVSGPAQRVDPNATEEPSEIKDAAAR